MDKLIQQLEKTRQVYESQLASLLAECDRSGLDLMQKDSIYSVTNLALPSFEAIPERQIVEVEFLPVDTMQNDYFKQQEKQRQEQLKAKQEAARVKAEEQYKQNAPIRYEQVRQQLHASQRTLGNYRKTLQDVARSEAWLQEQEEEEQLKNILSVRTEDVQQTITAYEDEMNKLHEEALNLMEMLNLDETQEEWYTRRSEQMEKIAARRKPAYR